MKRNLLAHGLLSALLLVPAALAACHSSSSGSSAAQPAAKTGPNAAGDTPAATGDDAGEDDDDDEDGGAPAPGAEGGGGGRKHGKHGKKHHGDGGGDDDDAGVLPSKLVINKPTPQPIEPPALRSPPKIPTLPNLPSKSKYPKQAEVPKGGDAEGCGQVWSGTEFIPVECVDPSAHAKHAKAAKVVVPYDKMKQPADKLPKMVDHHFDGTEGPIRHQAGPQCTAFAFTAGLDHANARWTGQPGDFSVMQVWARYRKLQEKAATDTNIGDFVANEADWPYDAKVANSWIKCGQGSKQPCGKSVDEEKLKELDSHKKVAEVTQIELVSASHLDVVREKIAGGQDVVIALKLPSFATAGEPGAKYVIGTSKNAAKEGHEVLLAGYADTPNGNYFLIHNSWGTKWGDEGYAWLHEDFIKQYWVDSRMVVPDVEPVEVMRVRARAHGELTAKCKKDEVPDSISGLCAGKCQEGGPRHNNACPDDKKNECPVGHINLTGACVLSAPKGSGSEGKVKWSCERTGCTYEMSKGELGCKEGECQISCPAPDFRLATMKSGLVCVE